MNRSFFFTRWHRPDFIFLFFNGVPQNKAVQCFDLTVFNQFIDTNFKLKQRFIILGFNNLLSEGFKSLAALAKHIEVNRDQQKWNH